METGGWFHCGRCGDFFRGKEGDLCPDCGRSPVVEESELAFLEAARQADKKSMNRRTSSGSNRPDELRAKSSKAKSIAWFVLGWILFLGFVVWMVNISRQQGSDSLAGQKSVTELAESGREFQEAYQACHGLVASFLASAASEHRAKLTYQPDETLRKMVNFQGDGLVGTDGEEFTLPTFRWIETPKGRMCESIGMMGEDRRLEFLFIKNHEGEWSIDWDNLVRYSTQPLSVFVAGEGPEVGEFRVFARRRAGSSGEQGDVSRIMLFEPRPWSPAETGSRSPEILVDPESETGRILTAAFELVDDEEAPYGTELHEEDPYSMARLRVRLRRDPENPKRIEIEEVLACHWFSIDDLGVRVEPAED
ncbi:hypothetical protein HAHE_28240 [Haloferula helveola]|uniref:DUF4178 domain-containing protein n=2 Tax=Haloferula helveola TaxID=490095 RepID=A0ABN6H5I1_9BACT|nr:hypothetical protein HAHE_28240 [Haloferula helveola]